jgi:iron complex transport system ATP-binding protein
VAETITKDRDVVLRAEAIDLVRGDRALLDQVSITVRAGEHWALIGPNGAGKSTLLHVLATYAYPTAGHVDILGRRLGRVDVFALRPMVGLVTTHHPVRSARTVRELVLTGATGTTDLAARWRPTAADLAATSAAIEVMGLGRVAEARWRALSQGERARALIARALMGRPRVLLLDEPAAGLDLAGREQLLASLDALRDEQPKLATVLVTHHLEELPASTSHALLLRDGKMLAAGPAADVLTTERVSGCFDYPVVIARQAGRWQVLTDGVDRTSRPALTPDLGADAAAAGQGAAASG